MKKISRYDHTKIEKKWQKEWAKKKIYKTLDPEKAKNKEKFYVLDMFPYPSGEGLHVGHPKGYIATDVISRMKRMQGYNVLHPMGFDAFGLPAEQHAIKMKTNPMVSVKKNVARYKKQLEILGLDYDWSREVNTTDPSYYKWTQWIFLKLLEKGLAYESYEPINWCPTCKTGLANEDLEDGKCERCGTPVEKKPMRQWILKITDYADRLLQDLDATDYSIPSVVDHVNPPRKDKKDVVRKNVHVIVFDPKTQKYLIIRNKKHGWDTVVIGGIEEGENPVDTALRELREETGYIDLEFKRQLGGEVKASYFAKHKDVNRIAFSTCLYFELKSDKRVEYSKEGEDEGNEPMWIDEKDFVPGKMVNSELSYWLERLGVEVTVNEKGIACFKDVRGSSAYRDGVKEVERNAVVAIVKHWSKDQYIGLKWKKVDWQTLITGGIEEGQTMVEAALAEIEQETGYKNIRFVRHIGKVDAKFYHNPKGVNRYGHFDIMYFELKDGKRSKLTAEEQANHEVVWIDEDKMRTFLTTIAQKYSWDMFQGKPSAFIEASKPLLDWPESIKEAQRNWIGRSEGMLFTSPVKDSEIKLQTFSAHFEAFKADTFLVIAPDHPLLKDLVKNTKNEKEILNFADELVKERNASGYEYREPKGIFTGRYTIDPIGNGELPIWIANYALADYGTGIVKCSAHDERDFAFAKKYNIPLKAILFPKDKQLAEKVKNFEICYADTKNGILKEPKEFNGKNARSSRNDIIKYLVDNKLAEKKITYRLKDWVFSRQRYWGEPIPVLHGPNGEVRPLADKELPLELPKVRSYEPTGTGESPLAAIDKWMNVKVGKEIWRRESNTMPQWAGSSWYYLRYMDPRNNKHLVDPKKEAYWNSTDLYVGGAEHATRHLIYARFWHKFLYDIGVVSTIEPFKKLQSVGLIMAEDGRKMSKRWGNVVNPDDIVATYGADTMRVYEMFMGPFEQAIAWNTQSMIGSRRFIERLWGLQSKLASAKEKTSSLNDISSDVETLLHQTIKKVTEDIELRRFNTAISAMMILLNRLEKEEHIPLEVFLVVLKLVAPFAPHAAEELWKQYGTKGSIHHAEWPLYDATKLESDKVMIVVQVNGKVRGSIECNRIDDKETILHKAKTEINVAKWLEGKSIRKEIYIPGKLVSLVVD